MTARKRRLLSRGGDGAVVLNEERPAIGTNRDRRVRPSRKEPENRGVLKVNDNLEGDFEETVSNEVFEFLSPPKTIQEPRLHLNRGC